MAVANYVFVDQILGKVEIVDETNTKLTFQGINARENDANVIMEGITRLLDIVGWAPQDVTRIINQDITESE